MARSKKEVAESYNSPFPSALRRLMDDQSVTQDALSKVTGKTRQTISQYVTGKSEPGYDTLVKIANYLNVSTDYMLGNSDVKSANPNIRSTSEYTGLSESAIKTIRSLKDNEIKMKILNLLLEDIFFTCDFTNRLFQYCLSSYRLSLAKARRIDFESIQDQIRKGIVSASDVEYTVIDEESLEDQTDLCLFRCNQRIVKIISQLPTKFYQTFEISEEDDDLVITIKK